MLNQLAAVPLHTLSSGPPHGPRALLLHGVQSSAAGWWRIAAALAASGHFVVAPDLRGHGDSPGGDGYSLRALAADIQAIGSDWDLVVGHSLGGTLAAQLLHDDPGFARRTVLLDPVFTLPEATFEAIVAGQLAELGAPAAQIRAEHPDWHAEDVRLKALAAQATTPAVNEAVLRDNRPWSHAHLLDHATNPVLILGSDPSRGGMLDPALGEALATRIAPVTYRRLDGVGHSAHRDDPARVISAL